MFYEQTSDGYILRIRVTPNASKCGINGVFTDNLGQDFLKISLNSVPEKGKANQELIKYLSKSLKLNKTAFSLLSGQTDRYKKILLTVSHNKNLEDLFQQMEEANDGKTD